MHKVLFRCKYKDSGKWVYWDMLGRITTSTGKISKFTRKTKYGESYYHFAHQLWDKLDRATLGECTGLKDGFKKLIFEGDILVGPYFGDDDGYGVVCWDNGAWEVRNEHASCPLNKNIRSTLYDVIGNIYDDPTLVEVDQ